MTDAIYESVYRIAAALEVPVVVLILLALLVTVVEAGAFVAELWRRRQRSLPRLVRTAAAAADALASDSGPAEPQHAAPGLDATNPATHATIPAHGARIPTPGTRLAADDSAGALLHPLANSRAMALTVEAIAAAIGRPDAEVRVAKELADFDFDRERRLGRTRMLVRFGPALGLMGTLIPLSPALDGLARGNVAALTQNLQVAFSVTVIGLLVGTVSFALSLTRERLYAQDYSDLEYVAATLSASGSRPEDTEAA